ncbi:MAG: winged-helix domain-containing protein [Candidatus Micrarchaeia archaeon]
MIPESQYIENVILVRDMRLMDEVTMTKASLIRWLALALGLINSNESRKSLLDLIEILFAVQLGEGRGITVEEIMDRLKRQGKRCSEKTIRYHLLRLERRGVVRRKLKEYSFVESDVGNGGVEAIIDAYDRRYNNSMFKIRTALSKLKGMY